MKVTLINCTPDALTLLLLTKQTRLSMNASTRDEIHNWTDERRMQELRYMLGTIESSWEFVDYVFAIEGVSRAFTHQLVRTRSGSYAQQSQRTVDMGEFDYVMPESFETPPYPNYGSGMAGGSAMEARAQDDWDRKYSDKLRLASRLNLVMDQIKEGYSRLIAFGANPQDARAILPTNVATNIIAKFNLQTLSHMAEKRLCYRTQGEYQEVFRAMRQEVLKIHPWADEFIRVACAKRGVCQFPNFTECPIKPGIFNPDTGGVWPATVPAGSPAFFSTPLTKAEIHLRWIGTRFEAVPKESK